MSLWSDFLTNEDRVVWKWTHYFPAYERHFQKFVNQSVTFLEIGCGEGGSLQMWKRYFGPLARIVGIDVNPPCKGYEDEQIQVRIGNQADLAFLQSVVDEFGPFDAVLDDGSHRSAHMIASFQFLYPHLQRNGVYMVEDLHACYWPEFEGGFRKDGSFIEFCKGKIDELHADWTKGALPPTAFTQSTLSMHVYDSIAVFERGQHVYKHAPKIGGQKPSFAFFKRRNEK